MYLYKWQKTCWQTYIRRTNSEQRVCHCQNDCYKRINVTLISDSCEQELICSKYSHVSKLDQPWKTTTKCTKLRCWWPMHWRTLWGNSTQQLDITRFRRSKRKRYHKSKAMKRQSWQPTKYNNIQGFNVVDK